MVNRVRDPSGKILRNLEAKKIERKNNMRETSVTQLKLLITIKSVCNKLLATHASVSRIL